MSGRSQDAPTPRIDVPCISTAAGRANTADGRANRAHKDATHQLSERTHQQGPGKATIMHRWHADNTGNVSDIPVTSSCQIPVMRQTTPVTTQTTPATSKLTGDVPTVNPTPDVLLPYTSVLVTQTKSGRPTRATECCERSKLRRRTTFRRVFLYTDDPRRFSTVH